MNPFRIRKQERVTKKRNLLIFKGSVKECEENEDPQELHSNDEMDEIKTNDSDNEASVPVNISKGKFNDWSLKKGLTLTSLQPLDWTKDLNLISYSCQYQSSPCQTKLLASIVTKPQSILSQTERTELQFHNDQIHSFQKSFKGLYSMWKQQKINEFWYFNGLFSCFFRKSNENWESRLLNISKGIKELMKRQCIHFASESNGILVCEGPDDIHSVFDFLLNWVDERVERRVNSTPTIVSPSPFPGGTMNSGEISLPMLLRQSDGNDMFKVTINGYILFNEAVYIMDKFTSNNMNGTVTLNCVSQCTVTGENQSIKRVDFRNREIFIERW